MGDGGVASKANRRRREAKGAAGQGASAKRRDPEAKTGASAKRQNPAQDARATSSTQNAPCDAQPSLSSPEPEAPEDEASAGLPELEAGLGCVSIVDDKGRTSSMLLGRGGRSAWQQDDGRRDLCGDTPDDVAAAVEAPPRLASPPPGPGRVADAALAATDAAALAPTDDEVELLVAWAARALERSFVESGDAVDAEVVSYVARILVDELCVAPRTDEAATACAEVVGAYTTGDAFRCVDGAVSWARAALLAARAEKRLGDDAAVGTLCEVFPQVDARIVRDYVCRAAGDVNAAAEALHETTERLLRADATEETRRSALEREAAFFKAPLTDAERERVAASYGIGPAKAS
ncbi:hypothetical protein M885DRAFT_611126 [Pelagophyceae sp. CCMP2097]|nr:hypothetical protein M885DRAFT_611126 [Pelagophyceae sp. CCMP2097]